jgi:hypothetical protein
MQAAIRFRRAVEDDALALSVLAEATFRAAFAESNTAANMQLHCAASYGQALQLAEIREPGRETLVAEFDGRLVAYVQLQFDAASPGTSGKGSVEIQRFYVDASHHGPDWPTNSWRTFLLELMRTDTRCYGSECGNEMQEPWLSIGNGALKSWGSTSSRSVTIPNATC